MIRNIILIFIFLTQTVSAQPGKKFSQFPDQEIYFLADSINKHYSLHQACIKTSPIEKMNIKSYREVHSSRTFNDLISKGYIDIIKRERKEKSNGYSYTYEETEYSYSDTIKDFRIYNYKNSEYLCSKSAKFNIRLENAFSKKYSSDDSYPPGAYATYTLFITDKEQIQDLLHKHGTYFIPKEIDEGVISDHNKIKYLDVDSEINSYFFKIDQGYIEDDVFFNIFEK